MTKNGTNQDEIRESTRFQPGVSGNPAGRGHVLEGPRAKLRKALRRVIGPVTREKLAALGVTVDSMATNADALAELEIALGLGGADRAALNKLWEQGEEPLKQEHQVTGAGGGPIQVEGVTDEQAEFIRRRLLGLEPEADK